MKEIKTKPEGGKPKLLESAAKAPKTAMKDLWLKSKEKSISELKETPFASQQGESFNAPANTAGDQMLSGMESTRTVSPVCVSRRMALSAAVRPAPSESYAIITSLA